MAAIGALLFVVVWLCGWAGGWCARGERQKPARPVDNEASADA